MSYVSKNLMSGEEIIYTAKIHWLVFVPSLLTIAISIFLMSLGTKDSAGPTILGVLLIFVGLYQLLKAFISKITTELAVTNKRVIAKVGLIRRNTIELNHSKVESYNIQQPIMGRILGYGTIIINGTGGGKSPIPSIDSPLDFRKHAMQAIDETQGA